jgi:hypothetical protein
MICRDWLGPLWAFSALVGVNEKGTLIFKTNTKAAVASRILVARPAPPE